MNPLKKLSPIAFAALFCAANAFSACAEHEHVWTVKWDGEVHWSECEEDAAVKEGSLAAHSDGDLDGKCDVCGAEMNKEGHSHSYSLLRDGTGHWERCDVCGAETEKEAHSVVGNYLCSCGYAFDAPAAEGQETKNFYIIGNFTEDRSDGKGWGETHEETWKFHRLVALDPEGQTQYVFERKFSRGEEFKIVNDAGPGYWDNELNSNHLSAKAKKYFGGNGNIAFTGEEGYYLLTVHAHGWTASVDATLLYAETGPVAPHEHSYASAWSADENAHWHAATCEHVELRTDEAEHSLRGAVCTVCGYIRAHECVPAAEWVQGRDSHWKNCALCDRRIEGSEAPHDGMPCGVCGYEVSETAGLLFEPDEGGEGYCVVGYTPYELPALVRIPAMQNGKPVTGISGKAFMNCGVLEELILPDSVTHIDMYAFEGCAKLARVTFGRGLKSIGESAFSYCPSLNILNLPEGLETIGGFAFEYTGLNEAVIPASVKEIGAFAFRMQSLSQVRFLNPSGWRAVPMFGEGEVELDVGDPAENAKNLTRVTDAYSGTVGYCNFTWKRS